MARKNPVSERDIEIGKRLAQAREAQLITQTALAVRIGIGRERLVKYEKGIVPLQFWAGYEACSVLNISQTWLATGRGEPSPFIQLDLKKILDGVTDRATFQQVYDWVLKDPITHSLPSLKSLESPPETLGITPEQYYSISSGLWFAMVPPAQQLRFIQLMTRSANRILKGLKILNKTHNR